jgi:voltage-gated potassium channel
MGKHFISQLLEKPASTWSITILIVFSVICFSLETLPDLDARIIDFLYYAEFVTVIVFTLEYLLRLYASNSRVRFVFSFYGLVDLIAILPFYLVLAFDLRSLRLLRLLRLARLLKLTRYNQALQRFANAIASSKEELILFTCASLIMIFLAAVGIYHFEHEAQPLKFRSIFDCLWWAVATLTTVGYGDVYPITLGGRLFTFVVLLIGLGMIAVPTGIITAALSLARYSNKES